MAKSKTKKATAATSTAHRPRVRVRMYRGILGDCFLVVLPKEDGGSFHLMIDCGVILGTPDPGRKMTAVVQDLIDATGGHVDLLVVTHEHWDHVSGFLQAEDLFATGDEDDAPGKLHAHDLWLAWTENPNDDLANLLRGERRRTERGLRMALQRLRAMEADERQRASPAGAEPDEDEWTPSRQVDSLLSFFGARGTSDALGKVREYARNPPRYCEPGEPPIELEDVPGVRFYVLGPPKDERLIKRSRPSRAHPEVYEDLHLSAANAFFASALEGFGLDDYAQDELGAASGARRLDETARPFDHDYRIPELQARQMAFFQRHYWEDAVDEDFTDQEWRRIDAEWLRAAVELALKLDDDTNNTSLVLAIELVDSGKVLLFPGDAQVGNWLSWESVSWDLDGQTVTGHDLVRRTALYKTGHHGSHNATLREKGLELMSRDDLIALVPVDHEMAKKKRWFKIPFDPLMDRLHEKTQGRLLRGDLADKVQDLEPPEGVSAAAWRRFQDQVTDEELYLEVRIEG